MQRVVVHGDALVGCCGVLLVSGTNHLSADLRSMNQHGHVTLPSARQISAVSCQSRHHGGDSELSLNKARDMVDPVDLLHRLLVLGDNKPSAGTVGSW